MQQQQQLDKLQESNFQADQFHMRLDTQINQESGIVCEQQLLTISINPYEELNCTKNADKDTLKMSYRQIISKKMTIYQRKRKALASQILSKPNVYVEQPDKTYKTKEDIFHYTTTCDFKKLLKQLQQIPGFINVTDTRKCNLLYLACQPGHIVLARYLLTKGININAQMDAGSTALHAASYYGHHDIVELLLLNGADMNIMNESGYLPISDAYTQECKDKFKYFDKRYQYDIVLQQIKKFRQKNLICLAYNVYNTQDTSKIEGIFLQINYKENDKEFKKLREYYRIPQCYRTCYHGTKSNFTEGIIKEGFQRPSKRGTDSLDGHIELGRTYMGVENWADAVFVSQSPFMAALSSYAEEIEFDNIQTGEKEKYAFLFQLALKEKGCHKEYPHTLLSYQQKKNEPDGLEWRVHDEDGLVITGIYFMRTDSKRCTDYEQQLKNLYGQGKITGIYGDEHNTLKQLVKFEDTCLMGHALKIQEKKVDCDICDSDKSNSYSCDICQFTRCNDCRLKKVLI